MGLYSANYGMKKGWLWELYQISGIGTETFQKIPNTLPFLTGGCRKPGGEWRQ